MVHEFDGTAKLPKFIINFVNKVLLNLRYIEAEVTVDVLFPVEFEIQQKNRTDLGQEADVLLY